ncbi:16S rRNA (uracil1498-N3)-methyltransferase [Trueperella bonasi]|uniref:Ribosomal RNA small subunit methyltransferase E n=1 Tax=Trueperella bonasi TaxID=312286 RepID=A0ABT9NDZ3_9ACTO|nr:16S rRNA (uracil(1498)-N(3))-methyltransferase [Trueperella bonasi]MDP9805612.1 16S rRNA (uracil1498-N3)-methyltransferase [Trueperella bonasi]
MSRPVYVDPELSEAAEVVLTGGEAHHAATVRRTQIGDEIDIVNGSGLRITIEVEQVSKTEVVGRALKAVHDDPSSPHLVIVQALAKGGRDEQAVETCTEFGADAFIPWMSQRTIVRWNDRKRAEKGRAKLADTAWAAAKQARRSWLPTVESVVTTRQLVEHVRNFPGPVYVCHEESNVPLVDRLPAAAKQIMVIIGPEGGITAAEVEKLTDAGAEQVLLGKHVLRSATAGAWASAVIRAKLS